MIGWYVDVGTCVATNATQVEYSNINQFEFSDINRPFTFITLAHPMSNISKQPVQNIAEQLAAVLGQDYYYQYTLMAIYDSEMQPYYNILAPSLFLSYPNNFDEKLNGERTKRAAVVYFRKQKKLYVERTGAVKSVYNVSDDGTLTKINDFSYSNPNLIVPVGVTSVPSIYIPYIINYDKSKAISLQNFNGIEYERNYSSSGWKFNIRNNTSTSSQFSLMLSAIFGDSSPDFAGSIPPPNPYEPGGPSGPTDPDLPPGTFDDESDPIPDSPLPTLSAANTGFTRIYNPTLSQVQALARYLWTDETVIETIWNHIKQFFENPMEAIIGFNLVPVPVPDGGTENFSLMYIDTGVQMTVAANQFVDLDCGTLEVKRYYGSALDQSPYTKVSCYLPYIGTVNLNTDEVMGTTLQVKYRVDIVSGSCVAKIFVDGNCLYQYSGHCAITIPISSADFSSYVSGAISVGKLTAAAITAGAGAAMATGVGEVAQQTNQVVTTTQTTSTARNPATGRQITTGTTTTVQTRESPADQSSTQASFSGLSPENVANTVGAIMSSKPHIEHSGSFSGNSGYLGVRRPFVIIERPNMCMPANYQALNGFPAMITMELGTCKGFTRVQQVQLTGLHATNPEQAEILELLKNGVIL